MAEKGKKGEGEDDGLQHTCEECGTVYEDTASIRRIINKLGGRFVCPDCLAEAKAGEKKAAKEAEEEEEEEEEEVEEAEEEEEPEPPKKKK